MVLGIVGKRKLRLRHKTNYELFPLYDSQLMLQYRSRDAWGEAIRLFSITA